MNQTPHVCPPWIGTLLLCPLRRLLEDPEEILGPHVSPGMTVYEPGCAKGYFTLPLARMVGPGGRVLCSDIQSKMLARLDQRAAKAGLQDRIEARLCTQGDLGLQDRQREVDFIAALHVIHEMSDPQAALAQMHDALKPGGRMLILEPGRHVSVESFRESVALARRAGFSELPPSPHRRGQLALLEKA
jgi:ubiquinone/menaquinone biosynthesis C-methylase UbiE